MILFIIYIEPLLLYLGRVVKGYPLESPILNDVSNTIEVCLKEKLEAYVDDAEIFITSDEEFEIVDRVVRKFERMSGAILNRSSKSKVMGLGEWKGRSSWPLRWLKTEDELKVFSFIIVPEYKEIVQMNWAEQLSKFRSTLYSWSQRALYTLSERAEVLSTFALSRLWYRAQVLPLTDFWAGRIESELRRFLWKGQQTRNLLPYETVCLPKNAGGLSVPFLRAKCEALLLRQFIRMLASRSSRKHIQFWCGGLLNDIEFQRTYLHFSYNSQGRKVLYTPKFFQQSVSLFNEAMLCERFDFESISSVTTKGLYLSYTETMPPANVETKYEDRNWPKIWKRLPSGVLSPRAKNCLYLIVHERVATGERGHRLMRNIYDSPLCSRCLAGSETIIHRFISCRWVSDIWNALREILESLDQLILFETDYTLLNLCYSDLLNEESVLWLLGEYLFYIDNEVVLNNRRVTVDDMMGYLESRRLICNFMKIPPIGHIPGMQFRD